MQLPKVKPVLFQGKTYSNGTHPILIRITNNRKHVYKSTGFSIPKEAWDFENNQVYEKKPIITKRQEGQLNSAKLSEIRSRYKEAIILSNSQHINSVIANMITEFSTLNQKLMVNEESLDVKNIKKNISPDKTPNNSEHFFDFGAEIQERYYKAGNIGTYKRYKTCLLKFERFTRNRNLKFTELDVNLLANFENHLQSKGYKINTIYNHLKTIRAVFYKAIKEGIIPPEKNPFMMFKLKASSKTNKQKLTIEEIKNIEQL